MVPVYIHPICLCSFLLFLFSPVYLYFTLPPPLSLPQGVSYAYTDNREVVYPFPYVTTVFSASNYCGSYGNKGAVMIFYPDDIQVSLYM